MITIRIKTRNALSVAEYSILLAIAILAIIPMQAYLKRAIQGNLRSSIDQLAPQFSYEHGNISTRSVEVTNSNGTISGGFNRQDTIRSFSRTTEEAVEDSSVEKQIGF